MEGQIEQELQRARLFLPGTDEKFAESMGKAIGCLEAALSWPATTMTQRARLAGFREVARRLLDDREVLLQARKDALLGGLRWWC